MSEWVSNSDQGPLNEAARQRVRERPSAIINAARLLSLAPEPVGSNDWEWQASCPGTRHKLAIDAAEERWHCPDCNRTGEVDDLEGLWRQRDQERSSLMSTTREEE